MTSSARAAARFDLALPAGYRYPDVISFHRRDPEQAAERVEGATLAKGLAWRGQPACLHVSFADGRAAVEVDLLGAFEPGDEERLQGLARRMLGLTQPVEAFERTHATDPWLGPLIAANPGLRVAQTATPFEAVTWAIIGQQISVSAATSVRRRLIRAAGIVHPDGLYCYPDARRLVTMGEQALRSAGLSRTKARTMRVLSERIEAGELPLAPGDGSPDVEDIRARLQAIRGVGPWTVNYALMRGFGWLDGSMEGDLGVRRNLQALLGRDDMPGERETRDWLAPFSPWRALVAAHLWAMKS